jgi:hypothetical protein
VFEIAVCNLKLRVGDNLRTGARRAFVAERHVVRVGDGCRHSTVSNHHPRGIAPHANLGCAVQDREPVGSQIRMGRVARLLTLGLLLLVFGATCSTPSQVEPVADQNCPESAPSNTGPDESVASYTTIWYRSEDGLLWAGPGLPGWRKSTKVLWVHPGESLEVVGKLFGRTDAMLKADIPCCYYGTMQSSALHFSDSGCWEVEARAGSSRMRIVVHVPPE